MASLMQSMLPWLQAGGTALTVLGQGYAGLSAHGAADSEARQLTYAAGQSRASAQRAAVEERRQARLLASRAQAVAAASGGGASDPTVVNTVADIAKEGEYRALTALYEGYDRAKSLDKASATRRSEGNAARMAGLLGAGGTLLSAGGEGFQRYLPRKSPNLPDPFDSYSDRDY
jgi:hypothetical protein